MNANTLQCASSDFSVVAAHVFEQPLDGVPGSRGAFGTYTAVNRCLPSRMGIRYSLLAIVGPDESGALPVPIGRCGPRMVPPVAAFSVLHQNGAGTFEAALP
jgi:hypothetical protein